MSVAAGVYPLAGLLQGAADILVGASVPAHSRRVFEAWPQSRLCPCWPVLLRSRPAPYSIHEMPHIVWRRTLSFAGEPEAARGSWSDLADAALALLANSALDEAAKRPQQEQQQQKRQHCQGGGCQMVHGRQFSKCSPSAGGNWEVLVQKCLRSKTVTADGLLGHGQQMDWRGGQEGVGQQEGQEVGLGWQDATATSASNHVIQSQLRFKSDSTRSHAVPARDKCLHNACLVDCAKMPYGTTSMTLHCCSLLSLCSNHTLYHRLKDTLWQVPAMLCMAEAGPSSDLASAAGCSSDSSDCMPSSAALQPGISDLSMHKHRKQAWLASSSADWGSMFSQDLATSEGGCAATSQPDAASKGHVCAAHSQSSAEHAAPLKPTVTKQHEAAAASEQAPTFDQLSHDQLAFVQQQSITGSVEQPAEQSASPSIAEAASQQAAAAMRQNAVHFQALVQRFEHMTVARPETAKPGNNGLGLLALAPYDDQASQQSLSEVKPHLWPHTATIAPAISDDNCSDRSDSVTLIRRCYAAVAAASRDMPWVEYSSMSQPPNWHLNTAFEPECSSAEQAQSTSASMRCAELALPGAAEVDWAASQVWPELAAAGAAGVDCAATDLWPAIAAFRAAGDGPAAAHLQPEGFADAAGGKDVSVQRSGGTASRYTYAVMSQAPAVTLYPDGSINATATVHTVPRTVTPSCYYCMSDTPQEVASWHTAS